MLLLCSEVLVEAKSCHEISAFTDNFDFWDQICPKTVFPVKNKKGEYHHGSLHTQISLDTKFQLNFQFQIFSFWTKFAKKRVFLV